MANQQHIEWLLEGVEAWNARRKKDDFLAEFSGANLSSILSIEEPLHDSAGNAIKDHAGEQLLASAKRPDLSKIDLFQAQLERTILSETIFTEAMLAHTNMKSADLQNTTLIATIFSLADMRNADLSNSVLRMVDFVNADLANSKFDNADVRTFTPEQGIVFSGRQNYCDFSKAKGLTQEQLDTMLGDSETRIPDGLKRPKHWPVFDPKSSNEEHYSSDSSDVVIEVDTAKLEMQTHPAEISLV